MVKNIEIGNVPYKNIVFGAVSFLPVKADEEITISDTIHFVDMDGKDILFDKTNEYQIVGIVHSMPGIMQGWKVLSIKRIRKVKAYEC